MKTSELIGPALDWAVAKCELDPHAFTHTDRIQWAKNCKPSTDWSQGGPIIEREKIFVEPYGTHWAARLHYESPSSHGLTPLIAAMRCYVASKLGDEIEIPEELK